VLREDNAAFRLCPLGKNIGLLPEQQSAVFERRLNEYTQTIKQLARMKIKANGEQV